MRNSQFFQRRFWLQRYRVSENPFFHELIPALTSPFLDRTTTYWSGHDDTPSGSPRKQSFLSFVFSLFRNVRAGHRYMKRLFFMISLNVAYSTVELLIGLFTGRVGKILYSTLSRFSFLVLTIVCLGYIWIYLFEFT